MLRLKRLAVGFVTLLALASGLTAVSVVSAPEPAQAAACVTRYVSTELHAYQAEGRLIWSDWTWRDPAYSTGCPNIWASTYRYEFYPYNYTCANVRVHWENGYIEPWKWLCQDAQIIAAKYINNIGGRFYFENCGWNKLQDDIAPGNFYTAY